MKEMLQKLREASVAAILQADDITALENLRVKYLGKKGGTAYEPMPLFMLHSLPMYLPTVAPIPAP